MAYRQGDGETPNMELPLPFIQTNADGTMVVNEDLKHVLSQAQNPVGVISIVGKYRTGKSYIMNRFFNSNAGFNLGPTIQSTTKGIWIWAKPHPLDPSRTLILLDTEGLHDVEKGDETHDMKLFSLALLLSNCLVYNAVGTLDDVIIQQLHLVTELTEHIKTREGEDEEGNHFNKYFPSFFLLLRDFFLDLKLDGNDCTPNEYMENALKLKPGRSRRINDYNAPRECIRQFFPRRNCFTLCKPVDDDAKLRSLDQVPEREIKGEFLSKTKEAVDIILREAKPFRVDGNAINGSRFVELAMMYVDSMNQGGIPCISNAVELLKNNECQRALEEAQMVFEQKMMENVNGKMPLEHAYLEKIQKIAHQAAMDHYSKRAMFDEEGQYMKKLAEELEGRYQAYLAENTKISVDKCRMVLMDCFKFVDENIKKGIYIGKGGYDKYKTDKLNAASRYVRVPDKGPQGDNVLNEFLQSRQSEEEAIINADKALTKKEKELAKENEERKRQEEKARAAEAEQQRMMQDFVRQQNEHQTMILKMQNEFQERQDKIMQEHANDMKEKEIEYNKLMSDGLEKQAEQYKTLIEGMKDDSRRIEAQHQEQMNQLQDYKKQHSELLDEMKEQRITSDKQIGAMQEQIKALQARPRPGGRGGCAIM